MPPPDDGSSTLPLHASSLGTLLVRAAESLALDALVHSALKVDAVAGASDRGSPWAVANGAMDFCTGLLGLAATWAVADPRLGGGVRAILVGVAASLIADRNRLLPPLTARRPLRDHFMRRLCEREQEQGQPEEVATAAAAAVPCHHALRFILWEKAAWTAVRGLLAALPLAGYCGALAVSSVHAGNWMVAGTAVLFTGFNVLTLLKDLQWLTLFAIHVVDALDPASEFVRPQRDARARLLCALLARDFERERAGGADQAPALLQPLPLMPLEWYLLARSARRESASERVWLLERGRAILQHWAAVERIALDAANRDIALATAVAAATAAAATRSQSPAPASTREWLVAAGAGETNGAEDHAVCAICLDRSGDGETAVAEDGGEPPRWTTFPCAAAHKFHLECLCAYLSGVHVNHRVCPCCRGGPIDRSTN